jgi:hypothetical protein
LSSLQHPATVATAEPSDSLLTNQLLSGRLSPFISMPASQRKTHPASTRGMMQLDGHCLCLFLLPSVHCAVAGAEEPIAQMLCEMPTHLLCKIDSTLPLGLVLRNSESCCAFCEAMRDESLWEWWLRRDFPHYVPAAASSSSCYAQYKQQVCRFAN